MTPRLRKTATIAIIAVSMVLVSTTSAELHDRGGGLIYDDVLGVTWLQDAAWHVTTKAPNVDASGKMAWQDAIDWATSLVYHDPVRNVDWDDWRLPNMLPVNGVAFDLAYSFAGLTDNGYNITNPASELAYMYHVNLGGVSLVDSSGNFQPDLAGIPDPSPFTGLNGATWSQVTVPNNPDKAFIVGMGNGHQNWFDKTTPQSPWAVRDGDVAITPDGDLDNNGSVNLADVLTGLRILRGDLVPTTTQSLHGDIAPLVNGLPAPDGIFNTGDYAIILQKSLGHISIP